MPQKHTKHLSSLPKIDLHRHIEGSVSPQTLSTLYHRYYNSKKPLSYFQDILVLRSDTTCLDQYIQKLATPYLKKLVRTPKDLTFVFKQAISDAAADNLSYLEIRFALSNFLQLGKSPEHLIHAIHETLQTAANYHHLTTGLILTLKRDDPLELSLHLAKLAAIIHKSATICGVDLAGNEHFHGNEKFIGLAKIIKKASIPFVVHAGEARGPESVKSAILELGADRIGHGVRSHEDPKVIKLISKKQIPLEVCPTSNLNTSIFKSYQDIPIRKFLEFEVPFIICTDNPVTSGTTLSKEINNLTKHNLLTPEEYNTLLQNITPHLFCPTLSRSDLKSTQSHTKNQKPPLFPPSP